MKRKKKDALMKDYELNTRCIHAGTGIDKETRALRRPITLGNSYRMYDNMDELAISFDWENTHEFIYPRSRHPNARFLEERVASLEGGEDCVVFATGVAAMVGVFFTFVNTGDHIICSRICYIGVHEFLANHFSERYGVEVSFVDTTRPEEVRKAVQPNTKLIHIETPGNPITLVSDIAAIAKIAKQAGSLLSVDSTYSGMVTQAPLELGADLVMHSLSKFSNGHGDGLAGAVTGRKDLITEIRDAASIHLGATISPFNAWLIMRSLETLPLRMKMHCDNTLEVARYLEEHPKVSFVRYPGLESHPQHSIAQKQMKGYGGVLNFGLKTDRNSYFKFLERLNIITHAVSLGHTESLIMFYPQAGDDPQLGVLNYPEDLGDAFLRMSIGLEDPGDLIEDLSHALDVI